MKQNKAIAYLRQLCCLGLDKEVVIPEFLRAVQNVLPSSNNTFIGFGEQLNPDYFLLGFEVSADLVKLGPVVITNTFTPECKNRLAGWFKNHPVLTDANILQESYYKSDMYNLVCRHSEQYHGLSAPVLQCGKPVGMINLFRPQHHKPFNNREQAFLTTLLPYVSHALTPSAHPEIHYESKNGLTGLMIMDTQGRILHMSNETQSLLLIACHPVLTLEVHNSEAVLAQKLGQLCRNLVAIFEGKEAAPPRWSYINQRGRFIFQAFWLNAKMNGMDGLIGLIGMTIEHQEPLALKTLRVIQDLPLSCMQKQVVILLAQGFSNEKIGEQLHVKQSTVKDYTRKIFAKLDIHHREELLPKLLALDNPVCVLTEPFSWNNRH